MGQQGTDHIPAEDWFEQFSDIPKKPRVDAVQECEATLGVPARSRVRPEAPPKQRGHRSQGLHNADYPLASYRKPSLGTIR